MLCHQVLFSCWVTNFTTREIFCIHLDYFKTSCAVRSNTQTGTDEPKNICTADGSHPDDLVAENSVQKQLMKLYLPASLTATTVLFSLVVITAYILKRRKFRTPCLQRRDDVSFVKAAPDTEQCKKISINTKSYWQVLLQARHFKLCLSRFHCLREKTGSLSVSLHKISSLNCLRVGTTLTSSKKSMCIQSKTCEQYDTMLHSSSLTHSGVENLAWISNMYMWTVIDWWPFYFNSLTEYASELLAGHFSIWKPHESFHCSCYVEKNLTKNLLWW